jgi:hypothetical protein
MPDKPFRDPLADLRSRLEETRLAAEQLAGEVSEARAREAAGEDSPSGMGAGNGEAAGGNPRSGIGGDGEREALRNDVAAMAQVVQSLVDLVPEDLREQVYEIMRQILLLLRALIDWLVERLPHGRGADLVVEDIPVA